MSLPKYVLGIDQSLSNTGLSLIDSQAKIVKKKTIITTPADGSDQERYRIVINEIENFLVGWVSYRHFYDSPHFHVAREEHPFQVYGRAIKNLVLAGRIDEYFLSDLRFGENFHSITDRAWKKRFSVEKPGKSSGMTVRKAEKFYLNKYKSLGSTVHEVDAYWIAICCLHEQIEKHNASIAS